jgi:LysR family transcriptional regulator, nitrogen assimilation regulatory protein
MEIRQLRYFVKIADLGSMSRASVALHIAQPALSHQMTQLEEELGQALLHRRHNGVAVTEHGAVFYRHARQILKELDDLPGTVASVADTLTGTVAVGLPQSTAAHYAMPLLAAARESHKGVRLELFDEISGNLLRGLSSGRLDFAVIVNDEDASFTSSMPLMDEELFLITRQDSPVDCARYPVGKLPELPLALPGIDHGVRSLIEVAVRRHGLQLPRPAVVANSMSVMRRAVQAGWASSVMPWAAVCDDIQAGAVRAIPLDPPLARRVHVCVDRDVQLSLAGQAMKDLLIAQTRQRVRSGEWPGAQLL